MCCCSSVIGARCVWGEPETAEKHRRRHPSRKSGTTATTMLSCPPIKRNTGIRKAGSMSFSGVSTCTCTHTHTQPSFWWMATVVGCCCGGGGSINEVHSFRSQLAPEERQWGGKLNLKEGKLCQQVTEACFDQTHSEVRRSHITGPIWRQYYALHCSAFFTQPVSAQESTAAAPNMN